MFYFHKPLTTHNLIKNEIKLTVGQDPLEMVDTYKYLGVFLDERLLFVEYINYLKGLISNRIDQLNKIGRYINTKTAILL